METVFNKEIEQRVAQILIDSHSYIVTEDLSSEFRWKHGIQTPAICDCRTLNGYPESSREIASYLSEIVQSQFPNSDLIIGVANSGIPWATRIADTTRKPLAYYSDTTKDYGQKTQLFGLLKPNARAVIVDDSCVTGQTIQDAIEYSKSCDIDILGIVSITNWELKSFFEKIKDHQLQIFCLTGYQALVDRFCKTYGLYDTHSNKLITFYQSLSN